MKSANENSRSSFRNKFHLNQSKSKTSINFGVENQIPNLLLADKCDIHPIRWVGWGYLGVRGKL